MYFLIIHIIYCIYYCFSFIDALFRIRIRPRFMRNVRNRTTKCNVLGTTISAPIGVAPTAMQKMAHPEGECANARGLFFCNLQKFHV